MSEIYKENWFPKFAYDVFESLPYFIIADKDGKVIYINEHYAKLFKKTADELIGKDIFSFIPTSRLVEVIKNNKGELNYHANPTYVTQDKGTLCQRILIYENGDEERGREAIEGAAGFTVISKSTNIDPLIDELNRYKEKLDMYEKHISGIYTATNDLPEILGGTKAIIELKSMIKKVAPSSAAVCIIGETGTGKELVSNAIHKLSDRKDRPFVKVNCAAIPKELMESELFGYEPGSFTGASRSGKAGKFELADKGTLLLDEVGELPVSLQAKLLRAMQDGHIERVGGTKDVVVNVRIICSTNRDLKKMVDSGQFRADLYYRLNTIEISVPPLRERKDDITDLAMHFIEKINTRDDLGITGISEKVLKRFELYDWPGNVRELEHCIERACILCDRGMLKPEHFDSRFFTEESKGNLPADYSLRSKKNMLEKESILNALSACNGNKKAAAEMLQIQRSALYKKLEKYGIK